VSDVVTLSRRGTADGPVDLEGVTPDRIAGLAEREIASLPVRVGSRAAKLGDFFDVRGERAARVCIDGDVREVHGIGAGMCGGELVIDGDAGCRVAAGMTGGEIIVRGSAGAEVAARARRGLVVVAGDVGSDAGRARMAGTLVVFGRTGPDPGRASRRGTIIALGEVEPPATYWYACTFEPPDVRLTLTYIQRQYHLPVDKLMLDGRYRRYVGDAGTPERGEILEWVGATLHPSRRRRARRG
jgi:formylmethanofuran dehydrogenase subunit C